ncbi:MAG: ABC transporter ATP-binding protein [Bacteroidetes bacterium]|nr:ABC transporter ATP-binding protein [Bacteroidota bacterium]
MSANTSKFNTTLLKRIYSFTSPYKLLLITAIAIILILSFISIVRPLLFSYALDNYVVKTQNASSLNNISLIALLVLVLESALQASSIIITNTLGQNIIKDLRNKVYTHILSLKNAYFDNTPVGLLVTRAVSDIESLSEVFASGFLIIAGDVLMLVVFTVGMLSVNWKLALIAFSTIPLLLIATAYFKKGVKKTFTMVRNAVANLNSFANEHIVGMRIVQLFNREEKEFENFKQINAQHRDANIKSIFYYSVFFPVVDVLSSLSIALVLWYAGFKHNTLQVSVGQLFFFVMMVNLLFRPIRMLADRLNTLQMGIVSGERIFKILDTNEKINDSGKELLFEITHDIVFKNVNFEYVTNHPILNNLSFSIKHRKTTAIVGATGAGKSTIINLISRFYEINSGEILINEKNIKNYTLTSLRKSTGVVLQDIFLFNDTVLNNIRLSDYSISLEQVQAATNFMGLTAFIESMPGGFDYKITERGQNLSAGQRQIIAFIRVFVFNPSLLVLDEATATIDSNTELLIQKATSQLTKNRTSIIIAHRLSTIKDADNILVFEKGKIVEQGNFNELINKSGKFKTLYTASIEGIELTT